MQDAQRGNENGAQEIEILRQALQQLQTQYQQDMQALRQQLIQPARAFQLSADQILKKFDHIRTFYGKNDYPLLEFFEAVENVTTLCGENEQLLRHGLRTVIKEKIQGEAKICIQRLGEDLSWNRVKAELTTHYRPRKSYKKLMDESRNLKVNSLRELFNEIKSINCQLNELYEFDEYKPSNYNPQNNDKNLVDVLKDMINGSYRSNIITRDMTLIEVFNVFDELGLLDEIDVIRNNCRKYNKDSRFSKTNYTEFGRENRNRREYRENQRINSNSGQNSHFNSNITGNNNQRTNDNSGPSRRYNDNFRQRNFHDNNYSGNRERNNNSGQYRQYNNNSGQYRQSNSSSGQTRQRANNNDNNVEPMEIGNIRNQDVNFTNQPRNQDCL